ncbi:MAG: hypothetical protein KAX39_00625 [candidate division Zixibacteria bacterium]|nr:hypothetical protein [candidate division Zixibacteria bacterium]
MAKSEVEPIFQELYVKLGYGEGEEFDIPRGIINYYSLEEGDALHCELLELKGLRNGDKQKVKKIGKDILVDIVGLDEAHGVFPPATFGLHNMEDYEYALLKIKKAIKRR